MNDTKDTHGTATAADPFFEAALDQAIAEDIARLKRAGYDKAAICARSHEIEEAARQRLQCGHRPGSREPW